MTRFVGRAEIKLINRPAKLVPIRFMEFDRGGELKYIVVEYPLDEQHTQLLQYDYGSEAWNEVVKGIVLKEVL